MTVIAYRDGVMAADTAVFSENSLCGHVRKIARAPDGTLAAATGISARTNAFRGWIETGMVGRFEPDCESVDDFHAIIVSPRGDVSFLDWKGDRYGMNAEWFSEGCAIQFLAGALAAGASAEDAVRLAIKHTAYAGGEVQVERLMGDH